MIKEHKQSGIKYISGGVSEAQRKAIAKIAQKYPVQLLFSVEGKPEPVTGVKVTVINVMGKKQLEAESEGPLFYFTPDSGRWTMDAEYDGERISMTKDLVGRRYLVLEYKFKAQH